jgi:hypothetical protein
VPYSRKPVTQFSTPLRGVNNKKSGDAFEIKNLKVTTKALILAYFPFTGVRDLEMIFLRQNKEIIPNKL